jgi:integrase
VSIPSFLADELAENLAKSPAGRKFSDLVFTAPGGGPPTPHQLPAAVLAPCGTAGRPRAAPDVPPPRHTAAAIAISEGAHPKATQARLGHASITTTLNVYRSLFPGLDEELASRLDAAHERAALARSAAVQPLRPRVAEEVT